MAVQFTVISGKPEEKKMPAGLMRQAAEADKEDKHAQVSLAELVSSLLAEVSTGITSETTVEVEVSGVVELSNKDGKVAATFDVGNETPGARTLKLKITSTVKPR